MSSIEKSGWQSWHRSAARRLERIWLAWGLCLASEWLVDPALAAACAEVLGRRSRAASDPPAPTRQRTPTSARRPPLTVALLALCLAACAPAPPGAAPQGMQILVANAGDRTVSVLDAYGRAAAAPLPLDGPHTNVVAGAAGTALTFGFTAGAGVSLISRDGLRWRSRPLMGADPKHMVEHAAALPGLAAVIYMPAGRARPGQEKACRLAVVDLATGDTVRVVLLCAPGEQAAGLVVAQTSEGRIAYVALWDRDWTEGGVARGRIVALDLDSGAVRRSLLLEGPPTALVLAAPAFELGPRLYCVQATGLSNLSNSSDGDWTMAPEAFAWRLLRLAPESLDVELEVSLVRELVQVTPSPDGLHLYATRHPSTLGTALIHLDLTTGMERQLATLPGLTRGLVVSGDALYATDLDRNTVRLLDRRTGAQTKTVATGRAPISAALVR